MRMMPTWTHTRTQHARSDAHIRPAQICRRALHQKLSSQTRPVLCCIVHQGQLSVRTEGEKLGGIIKWVLMQKRPPVLRAAFQASLVLEVRLQPLLESLETLIFVAVGAVTLGRQQVQATADLGSKVELHLELLLASLEQRVFAPRPQHP